MTQSQAAKQSWARAKYLAKLANIKPAIARNYIKTLPKESPVHALLDKNSDTRNPTIRNMVENAQKHNRPSKGNPTKPPRAGAPKEELKLDMKDVRAPKSIPYDLLYDLRQIQKSYKLTNHELLEATQALGTLIPE